MKAQLVNLAYDILAILLPVLALAFGEWLRRKIGNERLQRIKKELEAKQELAMIAVMFVEQAFIDLKGYEKYIKALLWLERMLEERDISFTDAELKALIEASLRAIKDSFGEEWANKAG